MTRDLTELLSPLNSSACSPEELQTRVDLAALYRLFAHFGWDDLTYSHVSARVPGQSQQYLINPYGLLFDEITASSLIKADFKGTVLTGEHEYNKAGHQIHTAILRARPEINYVLHSHTRAGVAVSAMQCRLLPISEHANAMLGNVVYHSYSVVGSDGQESERLVNDLGEKYLLILHNHGLLTVGRTAAEAFLYHFFLERACEIQVDALAGGQPLIKSPAEAIAELSGWAAPRTRPWGEKQWTALMRFIRRKDPSFEN